MPSFNAMVYIICPKCAHKTMVSATIVIPPVVVSQPRQPRDYAGETYDNCPYCGTGLKTTVYAGFTAITVGKFNEGECL